MDGSCWVIISLATFIVETVSCSALMGHFSVYLGSIDELSVDRRWAKVTE